MLILALAKQRREGIKESISSVRSKIKDATTVPVRTEVEHALKEFNDKLLAKSQQLNEVVEKSFLFVLSFKAAIAKNLRKFLEDKKF